MRNRGEEYYAEKRRKKRKGITRRTAIIIAVLAVVCVAIFYFTREAVISNVEPQELPDSLAILSDPDYVYCYPDEQKASPVLNRRRYREIFNDKNDVQIRASKRNGIEKTLDTRIGNYEDFGLVKIVPNQYYTIATLSHSVPYLVPKARIMANTIGKHFQDLVAEKYKGSVYKIRITSLFRSKNDVKKLRRRNRWATENSCHQYGTTIDISYQNYEYVSGPQVGDYELTELLAQTLYELREKELCYVLYERRNCFHLTLNKMDLSTCTATPKAQVAEPEKKDIEIPTIEPPKKVKPYKPVPARKKPKTAFDDKPSPLI